jgi:hypothetical protein
VTVFSSSVTDPVNVTKLFVLGGFAFASATSIIQRNFFSQFSDRKFGFVSCLFFLLVSICVLFASEAPLSQSFYGTYGRNSGFLLYFLLILVFIASLSVRENALFKKYLMAMWFAGTLNVLYALWVMTFGDFVGWNNPYGNLLGTFGNPNFIGSFFGMFSGLLMVAIVTSTSTLRIRVISLISIPLVLIGIYQSHAVQGRVLFAVSAVIVFFYYLYGRTSRNSLVALYLLSLVPVSVLAVMGTLQMGPLKAFLYKTSVSLRGEYWHAAWQTGIHNPLFGVGFDSFGDWYRRSRRESAMVLPGPDTVTNAAHNVYLDIFAFGGFALFAAYVLINIAVVVSIIRFTINYRMFDPVFVSLVTIWMSYQLQSIISINQIGLAIWGWALGGAIIAYQKNYRNIQNEIAINKSGPVKNKTRVTPNGIQLGGVFTGLGAVLGLIISAPPLSADMKWRTAQMSRDVRVYEIALVSNFMNPMSSMKIDTTVDTFQLNGLDEIAHKYALQAIKYNPNSYNAWRNLYIMKPSSAEEKRIALTNLKRLDPLNKDIINIK